jgi:hypothetical protein
MMWDDAGAGGVREPGGDLLFHVLRRSTIGAEGFHGRVRDGIGCWSPRCDHQAVAPPGRLAPLPAGPGRPVPAVTGGIGGWEFVKARAVSCEAPAVSGACRCTPAGFPVLVSRG